MKQRKNTYRLTAILRQSTNTKQLSESVCEVSIFRWKFLFALNNWRLHSVLFWLSGLRLTKQHCFTTNALNISDSVVCSTDDCVHGRQHCMAWFCYCCSL